MPIDRFKKHFKYILLVFVVEILLIICLQFIRYEVYASAVKDYKRANYELALQKFELIKILGDYRELNSYLSKIGENYAYEEALDLYNKGENERALEILMTTRIDGDANDLYNKIINEQSSILRDQYDYALSLMEDGKYEFANNSFEKLQDYADSETKRQECENRIKRLELGNIISAGTWASAGVLEDHKPYIAIDNGIEGAKQKIESWEDIISIDVSGYYAIGLTIDGKVKCERVCENETNYDMSQLEKIDDAIQVVGGTLFVAVLKDDGTVVTSGKSTAKGESLDTSAWKDVSQIAAGRNFLVGVTNRGELLFAGKKAESMKLQYENRKSEFCNIVKVVAGGGENNKAFQGDGHIVVLKDDDTVLAIGDNKYGQCEIDGAEHVRDISAGDWHTSAIFTDNHIENYGRNRNVPSQEKIIVEKNIISISAGFGYSVYLFEDGKIDYFGFDHNNGMYELMISNVTFDHPQVKKTN